jgi:hypothetical protein
MLLHLKNMLASGTANLRPPIGNAVFIQVKFGQAFGANDGHRAYSSLQPSAVRAIIISLRIVIAESGWLMAPLF